MKKVVILGASKNPQRYSYLAWKRLEEKGFSTLLINPNEKSIEDTACLSDLKQVETNVDTVTIYVNPEKLAPMVNDLLQLAPRRVIFNPGTESTAIQSTLEKNGILVEQACTLVLLNLDQF